MRLGPPICKKLKENTLEETTTGFNRKLTSALPTTSARARLSILGDHKTFKASHMELIDESSGRLLRTHSSAAEPRNSCM